MTQPRSTSVIVLNWNGERFLETCIASLLEQNAPHFEVVVADNGSTDGSESIVAGLGARWLPLGRNHGFAKGNNLAAEQVDGDLLVFVNNDMRFPADFLQRLIRPLEDDDELFATDARQRDWDDDHDIHRATFVRRYALMAGFSRGRSLPLLDLVQIEASDRVAVSQACAGSMAVRRSMFEALGGFDPRLPAGWEDTELCWRSALMGWRTLYVPESVCWHHVGGSSSSPEGESIKLRGTIGGKLLFATKHLPLEQALLTWCFEALGPIRELLAGRAARARERALIVTAYAALAGRLRRERRDLYGRSATDPRTQLRKMVELAPG